MTTPGKHDRPEMALVEVTPRFPDEDRARSRRRVASRSSEPAVRLRTLG